MDERMSARHAAQAPEDRDGAGGDLVDAVLRDVTTVAVCLHVRIREPLRPAALISRDEARRDGIGVEKAAGIARDRFDAKHDPARARDLREGPRQQRGIGGEPVPAWAGREPMTELGVQRIGGHFAPHRRKTGRNHCRQMSHDLRRERARPEGEVDPGTPDEREAFHAV